jgi:lipopolysaccharide export system permease protein
MKIVDRYLLSSFIKNYLISVMVLVGMYVALDMVFNFGNLTQSRSHGLAGYSIGQVAYDIGKYYMYQSLFFFVQLSGAIAVLAATFTLMRLSRFNETTALLAAGMPLARIAASVIIAGATLNLILLPLDQELIIPRLIPHLARQRADVHEAAAHQYAVQMMQDEYNGLFNAALYAPPTPTTPAQISYLDVIERDGESNAVAHVYADSAVWNERARRWDLTNGWRVLIASPKQIHRAEEKPIAAYRSDITPDEIALNHNKDYVQFLAVSKIVQLLERPKSYGTLDLLRALHTRFTQPIVNVILLLLAISTVLTRQPQTLKSAAVKCMVLSGLCMGSVFLCYELAGAPPPGTVQYWPALMAWLPIFIFGPLSAYLLQHLKT